MNITSAKYISRDTYDSDGKVTSTENCGIVAVINGETLGVPVDPANRHYAAILEWAEEDGNTIQEAD
tara:strand:- start:24 stop:224 length:201 start_codon:yes stop_codon:yes gene_type:complete